MSDKATQDTDVTATEEPTVVVVDRQPADDGAGASPATTGPELTGDDASNAGDAGQVDARAKVDEALKGVQESAAAKAADARDRAGAVKDRAAAKAAEAREKTGERASDVKERASAKAGEAKDKAASLLSSARERTANTDVKELAASTTSLIDSARPFFLAAFAVVFTVLGFVEGDSGTSQLFVVGAILFVLAAGFSDELSHLAQRRRRATRDAD